MWFLSRTDFRTNPGDEWGAIPLQAYSVGTVRQAASRKEVEKTESYYYTKNTLTIRAI